jgi:hypothetical protein
MHSHDESRIAILVAGLAEPSPEIVLGVESHIESGLCGIVGVAGFGVHEDLGHISGNLEMFIGAVVQGQLHRGMRRTSLTKVRQMRRYLWR